MHHDPMYVIDISAISFSKRVRNALAAGTIGVFSVQDRIFRAEEKRRPKFDWFDDLMSPKISNNDT